MTPVGTANSQRIFLVRPRFLLSGHQTPLGKGSSNPYQKRLPFASIRVHEKSPVRFKEPPCLVTLPFTSAPHSWRPPLRSSRSTRTHKAAYFKRRLANRTRRRAKSAPRKYDASWPTAAPL